MLHCGRTRVKNETIIVLMLFINILNYRRLQSCKVFGLSAGSEENKSRMSLWPPVGGDAGVWWRTSKSIEPISFHWWKINLSQRPIYLQNVQGGADAGWSAPHMITQTSSRWPENLHGCFWRYKRTRCKKNWRGFIVAGCKSGEDE